MHITWKICKSKWLFLCIQWFWLYSRKVLMTKCLGTDHKTSVMVQRPFDVTSNKSWQSVIKIHEFIPYLQAKASTDYYHQSFSAQHTKSLLQTLVILFPCIGVHFYKEPALLQLFLFSPFILLTRIIAHLHMAYILYLHKIKQGISWIWKHLVSPWSQMVWVWNPAVPTASYMLMDKLRNLSVPLFPHL